MSSLVELPLDHRLYREDDGVSKRLSPLRGTSMVTNLEMKKWPLATFVGLCMT